MGLYEGIKDVAKIVQQADNLELYRQLLDLSACLTLVHLNRVVDDTTTRFKCTSVRHASHHKQIDRGERRA